MLVSVEGAGPRFGELGGALPAAPRVALPAARLFPSVALRPARGSGLIPPTLVALDGRDQRGNVAATVLARPVSQAAMTTPSINGEEPADRFGFGFVAVARDVLSILRRIVAFFCLLLHPSFHIPLAPSPLDP